MGEPGHSHRELALAGLAYVAGLGLSAAIGLRMELPAGYWQLLPLGPLEERWLESLYHLHAQPPLPNALLGLALKLARASGVPVEWLLFGGHVALGGAAVYAFVRLAQRLVPRAGWRRAAIAIFVAHPVLYMTLHQYFYTFPELALLLLAALAGLRLLEGPGSSRLALYAAAVTALVWTHNLFHWTFGLAAIGAPILALRGVLPRGGSLAVALAAALLLLGWPAKNAHQFGFFGYTSWRGFHLIRDLPVDTEGLAPIPAPSPRHADVAVLTLTRKPDGTANWNHHGVIARSREFEARALALMREQPEVVIRKALANYWSLTRFAGRHPFTAYYGNAEEGPPGLVPWMKAFEWVLFQDFRGVESLARRTRFGMDSEARWRVSGFTLLYPLLLGASALAAWRRREADRVAATLVAAMLGCVLWVTALVLLVDGTEGNRIRFSCEPFLWLLAAWLPGARPRGAGAGVAPRGVLREPASGRREPAGRPRENGLGATGGECGIIEPLISLSLCDARPERKLRRGACSGTVRR